jgi:hypothetical protein
LTIAGHTVTVTQAAAPPSCAFSLAPSSQSVAADGGATSVAITATPSSCAWTAAAGVAWIAVTSPASGGGTGSGTVTLTVAANAGAARSGVVSIGGQPFTVNQAAAQQTCGFTVVPDTLTVDAPGGSASVTVTATQSSCPWTAASNASWIALTSSASNTGSGTVTFQVDRNTGASRSGTLTIAGRTVTVTQREH